MFKFIRVVLAFMMILQVHQVLATEVGTSTEISSFHPPLFLLLNDAIHKQMNLSAEQESQWQSLKEENMRLRQKIQSKWQKTRNFVNSEAQHSASNNPEITNSLDNEFKENRILRKKFHDELQGFYDHLSSEQKSTFLGAVQKQRQAHLRNLKHNSHQ